MNSATQDKINKLINNACIMDTLVNLRERWQDERGYEDFKDYESVMESLFESYEDVKFVKGIKRPFGMALSVDETPVNVFLRAKGNYLTLCASS